MLLLTRPLLLLHFYSCECVWIICDQGQLAQQCRERGVLAGIAPTALDSWEVRIKAVGKWTVTIGLCLVLR